MDIQIGAFIIFTGIVGIIIGALTAWIMVRITLKKYSRNPEIPYLGYCILPHNETSIKSFGSLIRFSVTLPKERRKKRKRKNVTETNLPPDLNEFDADK